MYKTFLFVIGLLFGYAANSQAHFGAKAGVNLANQVKTVSIPQTPQIKQDTKLFLGYQVGAFFKAPLSGRLSVSAEPGLSVVGSSMKMTTTDGTSFDAHEKLGYIELPLTLQYKAGKVYFGAGPSAGLKVFAKISGLENRSYDIPYYKNIDAAATVLAGYSLTEKLDLNIRYSHGLVNLFDDPGYADTKNRAAHLSLLYFIR